MKRLHLTAGLASVFLFLFTGQLMYAHFPDKEGMDQALRMVTRSRHVYILLSAFPHLLIGVYFARSDRKVLAVLQKIGSVLLTLGSAAFAAAFFYESYSVLSFSPLSAVGVFLATGGVLLHTAGALRGGDK